MEIPEEIVNRKGARKPADVPKEVLELLHQAKLETVNLSEWLAVDQRQIFEYLAHELKLATTISDEVFSILDEEKKPSSNTFSRLIGQTLEKVSDDALEVQSALTRLPSDVARCWAAHMVGVRPLSIPEKLDAIKPYAADTHFGVREISFMAVKKDIAENVDAAIQHLIPWTQEQDSNVRRFAVEATRPIGVWTNKIDELKCNPGKAVDLLEPLRSDPAKYVQDAVANWLNDASKSRPEWVQELCDRWSKESDTKETSYILKRALRTINKKV